MKAGRTVEVGGNEGGVKQDEVLRDIVEWDMANWSRALKFWETKTSQDLSTVDALEVGSRNGGLSLWIARHGGRCLCTDLHGPQPAAAEMHRRYGLSDHVTYGALDVTAMTYSGCFDVVLFKSVLGGLAGVNIAFRRK